MSHIGFWKWAEAEPERPAVFEVTGERVTYGELAARAHQTAHALLAQGLRPGDTIATLLRNSSVCPELFLAALNCGWYYVPINYHSSLDDVAYILGNSEARVVVTATEFAGLATGAGDIAGIPDAGRYTADDGSALRTLQSLRAGQPVHRPDSSTAGQVMQYTSGTTGRSKGVRRPMVPGKTADAAIMEMSWLLQQFGVKPGDGAHLVTAPLYHSAVHSLSMAALHFGQAIVLMDKWTAENCLELIGRHHITTTHMVATHFHRLLQLPESVRRHADVSSLAYVIHGATPTPVDTKRRMLEWWGPVIYEYYGSSEVGGTAVGPTEWLERPGTVGRPFTISEVKILDAQGNELPRGTVGEIWMRQGDQNFSYYKDPDKTGRQTRGKFIHVGDVGYLDDAGYLFLSGRDSEIINVGGVKIYPAAIEAHLLAHPLVRDCGVIGVPNDEYGEEIKAVVILDDEARDAASASAELLEHCRRGLSRQQLPRSIDIVDELPRDPNGKLQKSRLRARYWAGREKQI